MANCYLEKVLSLLVVEQMTNHLKDVGSVRWYPRGGGRMPCLRLPDHCREYTFVIFSSSLLYMATMELQLKELLCSTVDSNILL